MGKMGGRGVGEGVGDAKGGGRRVGEGVVDGKGVWERE